MLEQLRWPVLSLGLAMRRRGAKAKNTGRQACGPKRRIGLTRRHGASTVDLVEQLDRRTQELEEALQREAATTEVLKVISSSPAKVSPVFKAILESACRLCDSKLAAAFRFDGTLLHLEATENWTEALASYVSRFPMRPSPHLMVGRIVLTKSVVIQEDTLADPNYEHAVAQAGHWRRMLGVPMMRDGEVIGGIVLAWQEPGPISARHVELLQNFAAQAVIATENARLLSELHESLSNRLLPRTCSRSSAARHSICRPCSIRSWSRRRPYARRTTPPFGGPTANASPSSPVPARLFPSNSLPLARGTVAGRAILDGRTFHIADIQREADEFPASYEHARHAGFHALLCVPLMREGVAIGAIALRRTETQFFNERQVGLLQTFADQAVIAIENARLLNELRQRTDDLEQSHWSICALLRIVLVQTQKLASLWSTHRWYRARDQEPAQFRQQFLWQSPAN